MQRRVGKPAGYGIAIAAVAIATLLALAVRAVRLNSPYLLFTIAVMASAALGGFGAGVFAVVLSGVSAVFFLIEPVYTFRVTDRSSAIPLVLFGFVGVTIAWGVALLTRAR